MAAAGAEAGAPWYEYIDRKRRHNFLAILEELSWRQDKQTPQFIVIGALALLMQNYLHYVAWWDVDLLFRDHESLQSFANSVAAPGLQITHLDDDIILAADLECLHTMWSFNRTWANVDYIYRPQRFEFFHDTLRSQEPFSRTVQLGGREYHINLVLGHPWDIFVDKLTLRRTVDQLQQGDSFGIDLRHLVIILRRDQANEQFWKHIVAKSEALGKKGLLKDVLLRLIEIAPELGYTDVAGPQEAISHFAQFGWTTFS